MARGMRDVQRDHGLIAPVAPSRTVLTIGDADARDAIRAGAKASSLAIAAAHGLPVLPGVILTSAALPREAFAAWTALTGGGTTSVAVRSSSANEDQVSASMAGHFETVLDVDGWDATVDAIERVRASADGFPMAVLIQPMCEAATGGVLFGVDPVSGRTDRLVVEVVDGGPHQLVSGEVSASRSILTPAGRQVDGATVLKTRDRVRLARLARSAARVFGGPQDIEWAIDRRDRLWLLQSRPITAVAARGTGALLGPGPVAETFPDPLSPLELDLWAEPLRVAIVEALHLVGVQPRRAIASSPVVVDVGGRLAVDLDLIEGSVRSGILAKLDPRPPARRFVASWRVGRLRRSLPLLAADVVEVVDSALHDVPRLDALDDDELIAVLGRCRVALRSVHAHEVLAGVLLAAEEGTGIEHALAAVSRSRAAGRSDADIATSSPVALALVPPRIGEAPSFPDVRGAALGERAPLGPREALRLRARWLQELSARAAAELGVRLTRQGRLDDPLTVRWLTLDELVSIVGDGTDAPADVWIRLAAEQPAPLPAAFRLAVDGTVVPAEHDGATAGHGAGGGRGAGIVAGHDGADGTVLVVRTLDPRLASLLPGRAGLVAETGSTLSHLAIVARELGVPTVIGVIDAVERFPVGTHVLVDGTTGEVEVLA